MALFDPTKPPISLEDKLAASPPAASVTGTTKLLTSDLKTVEVQGLPFAQPTPAERAAAGDTVQVIGALNEDGSYDSATLAAIAVKRAEGWPDNAIYVNIIGALPPVNAKTPAERAADGEIVQVIGYTTAEGEYDQPTLDLIAEKQAAGWPDYAIVVRVVNSDTATNPFAALGIFVGTAEPTFKSYAEWYATRTGYWSWIDISSQIQAVSVASAGGLVLGGSAAIVSNGVMVQSVASTGGAVVSGAASVICNVMVAGMGGAVVGGTALVEASGLNGVTVSSIGGIVSGGANIAVRGAVVVSAGGSTLGGAALAASGVAVLTFGGIALGGAATVEAFSVSAEVTSTGGMVIGGTSIPASGRSTTASGGVVAGGTILVKRGTSAVGAGGAVMGGAAVATGAAAGFTDTFTAADGTLAQNSNTPSYWSSLITAPVASLRSGSYQSIQSNVLRSYIGSTSGSVRFVNLTANAIAKIAGRYIEITEVVKLPTAAAFTDIIAIGFYNADDYAPDVDGRPTKNYAGVYWYNNNGTTQVMALEQYNSSGVQSQLGTYTDNSPANGTAYRATLSTLTTVSVQKNGSTVIAAQTLNSVTLGTNIKGYIQIITGRTNGTFLTYDIDDAKFL